MFFLRKSDYNRNETGRLRDCSPKKNGAAPKAFQKVRHSSKKVQDYFFLIADLKKIVLDFFKGFSQRPNGLLCIIIETLLQEIDKLVHILVIGVGTVQGVAFVVNQHVERLRVGAEFGALQVAPFVAYGA